MSDDDVSRRQAIFEAAQRQIAARLARAPDEFTGWLVCLSCQFPPPTRPPHQDEVERWFRAQAD